MGLGCVLMQDRNVVAYASRQIFACFYIDDSGDGLVREV